jgi:hypothetical protein
LTRDVQRIRGTELQLDALDPHVGVHVGEPRGGGVHLGLPKPAGAVNHLALEVRLIHHIEVDQPQRSHAGSGEVQRGG